MDCKILFKIYSNVKLMQLFLVFILISKTYFSLIPTRICTFIYFTVSMYVFYLFIIIIPVNKKNRRYI